MVARVTLAGKNMMVLTHCASQTPLGAKSVFSAKSIHMLGRGCTFCFVTFQIHLSSQNFYVNDLGMTRPIFWVPGQNKFTRVEICRIWTGFSWLQKKSNKQEFSLCRTTTASVFQTYRNSSCWEEQQSLSSRHTESLSCRNTQYRGGSKRPKLSRNGSRMDDMRNRDRENDRTGPRSIFRPLPDPQTPKNRPKIVKNPVWGPSLGLCFCPKCASAERSYD